MATAYIYTLPDGYYSHAIETAGYMHPESTDKAPEIIEGHVPRWTGTAWEQVADHKGKQGYLDGQPHTIAEYGPLPEGWSDAPPEPTPEEQQATMQAQFTAAIQQYLDKFAQTRNYDNIMSAATYATSTVPRFRAEGQYAVEARDITWATAYSILDAVLSGQRPMPELAEVLAELPQLAWPDPAA